MVTQIVVLGCLLIMLAVTLLESLALRARLRRMEAAMLAVRDERDKAWVDARVEHSVGLLVGYYLDREPWVRKKVRAMDSVAVNQFLFTLSSQCGYSVDKIRQVVAQMREWPADVDPGINSPGGDTHA
jgi:hypothetical protein